jgi:NADH-quinone oxidoreductase subunit E
LQKRIAELKRAHGENLESVRYPRPQGLLDQPVGEPDDLKRIRGIGPVLEDMLNDLGIFHFHQIAAFSDDDVHWVANNLDAFSDRVLRDDWVEQAAAILAESRNGRPE